MSKLDDLINKLCPDGVEYKTVEQVTKSICTGLNPRQNFRLNSDDATDYYVTVKEFTTGKIKFTDKTDRISKSANILIQKRSNLEKGDILLSGIGTIGKVAIVDIPTDNFNCSESVYLIKLYKDLLIPGFLVHILRSDKIQNFFYTNARGSTLKGIRMQDLKNLEIPVPPLEIQNEIVRILDNFTELEEELEEELEARRKQYEYYRDSLLTFDDSVEWTTLENIADIGTGSSNTNEGLIEGLYPFYVRSPEVRRKNTYEYDETAIITSGDGVGVGKIFHYVEGKYALHQRAYRIHINTNKIIPKFYYFYMKTTFYSYINKEQFKASVQSIRRPMLNKYPVPIPSIKDQERIVAIMERFEVICNDITSGLPAEIEARHKQYEYYRDKLLTFKRKNEK